MRWPRRLADNARSVRATIFGPNPISLLMNVEIDAATTQNLARPTRELRVGENYTRGFGGDCGIVQPWPTPTQAGGATVRPKPNVALPATSPPPFALSPSIARMQRA